MQNWSDELIRYGYGRRHESYEFSAIDAATFDDILRALGAFVGGTAGVRKLRLRLQCGLKQEAV